MEKFEKERRKYHRYDIETKLKFRVSYDLKAVVKYRFLKNKCFFLRHSGLTNNISVEGLRFLSKKRLKEGDLLLLDVYISAQKQPIRMTGEVRWSMKLPGEGKYKNFFYTGVKLNTLNGQPVAESIYHDSEYDINWSIVLETVFGGFKEIMNKIKKR